jgi:uroporphyrinogen III methyltransferase/synthase
MPQSRPPKSAPEELTLQGRRVVVTRRSSQSTELLDELQKLGAAIVSLPSIEVGDPESYEALDRAIDNIGTFDWLVFTSANGVRYFHARLKKAKPDAIEHVNRLVVCAIGAATARAAEEAGLIVSVTPQDSQAEGLLRSIIDYAGNEQALRGLRFLLPRSNIARATLIERLSRLGAAVHSVEAYRTVLPQHDLDTIVGTLAEPIDVVTFTSPSTVQNLVALVGADRFSNAFGSALAACIGPVTAQAASQAGLTNVVYPEERTAQALVSEIVKWFR